MRVYALESGIAPEEATALSDLLAAQDNAAKTGDYDELHKNNEEILKSTEAVDSTDLQESEPMSDMSPDDAQLEENESDPSLDEEADLEPIDEESPELTDSDGKRQTPVTESLRNEYYNRIILESFDDGQGIGTKIASGFKTGAAYLGSKLFDGAVALKELGVEYGPGILQKLKKTIIYLFIKATKLVLKMIVSISDYTKRHVRSFSKSNEKIKDLREKLNSLKTSGKEMTLGVASTSDESLVSWFTAGGKTDVLNSASVMTAFMSETIRKIDTDLSLNLQSVKKLIDISARPITGNPLSYLAVPPFSGKYLRKSINGHERNPELVDSLVYAVSLPDQVLFAAILPRPSLSTMDEISSAYRESGLFLTTDAKSTPSTDKVDYMDTGKLEHFLDVLEGLCNLGLEHTSFYERIGKAANDLKFGYRHYYQRLTETAEQASIRESLVEYVYLKQSFATRVYIPAAMDIHDYTAAYLVRALRFVKDNIEAYRVKSTESTD